MAENLQSERIPKTTVTPRTTLVSSMPLQLSGFLSGNTIQVEGDTGNLQFSVKFDIHHHNKYLPNNGSNIHFPSLNSMESNIFCQNSSSSSSSLTPKSTQQMEDQILDLETLRLENREIEIESNVKPETTKRRAIMTRLRSGAISQVKYYFPRISREKCKDLRSRRTMKLKKNKKRERVDILFDKLLRRRSCPVKPCNSYVFFVMARWVSIKSSSFSEASKRLSQMWCKLPRKHKKIYEDIALKDRARYKRQCMLLNSFVDGTFSKQGTEQQLQTDCM